MSPRFLKPSLANYQPYVPGEQPPDGEGWIKLNTNESPYPPSPAVLAAIGEAAAGLRLYPSPSALPARRAIAAHHGLDPDMVIVTNGGDELIRMCFTAFAGAGDTVAVTNPTYPLFLPLCPVHELTASVHDLESGWRLPESFGADPAPLKFLPNPNSPTGAWHGRDEVSRAIARSRGVFVLDEAYVDFAPGHLLDLLGTHRNLLVLRTFSKAYGLAGLRIGYGLGDPDLIAELGAVRDSYNMNRLAIAGAAAAILDTAYLRQTVARILAARAELTSDLRELGFEVEPSAANFVLARPPAGVPGEAVYEALKARRILVRLFTRPPVAGCLRITVGTPEQQRILVDNLGEIVRLEVP